MESTASDNGGTGTPHAGDGLDRCIGTVEHLMVLAWEGRLSKHLLTTLLQPEVRATFLQACARIEKQFTEACTAKNDPCLASGCALEGEVCLQPLLAAGDEYHKACGAAWVALFADPCNRIELWRR